MPKRLLPLIPPVLIVVQVLPTPDHVIIVAQLCSPSAACPDCGILSHSVHSRYERHLGDLPWQGRPVALRVQARRFRCPAPACTQQTFAERLLGIAAAAARRTERLGGLHSYIGLALGGEAGARLALRLAIGTSPDTLLRAVRRSGVGVPPAPTPRVLGVDDWAKVPKVPPAQQVEWQRRGGAVDIATARCWWTWSAIPSSTFAGPPGRNTGYLAAPAPRRGGDRTQPGRRLCRWRAPGRPGCRSGR